jgi:hypothetical protein
LKKRRSNFIVKRRVGRTEWGAAFLDGFEQSREP